MRRNRIKGIHRVKKRLSEGSLREYHYAYRGGPCFWHSGMDFGEGEPDYIFAYNDASRMIVERRKPGRASTAAVIDRFRRSAQFQTRAPRTQRDYEKYLATFEQDFGEDPIAMFEEPASVGEINEWKNKRWQHSPKQWHYATTVVTRLLNWAQRYDATISLHHHNRVKRLYKAHRAEIIWTEREVEALISVATALEARVVVAISQAGLTPQDIGKLTMEHVQRTPKGRRLYFQRTKSSNPVSIPVTPKLADLIDSTPQGQEHLVVALRGGTLTAARASQIINDLKLRANRRANENSANPGVHAELRPNDMRGTAATELRRAGCSLNEIALFMGWGLRHAANVIENYAALVPEVSDEVLRKLAEARKRGLDGSDR